MRKYNPKNQNVIMELHDTLGMAYPHIENKYKRSKKLQDKKYRKQEKSRKQKDIDYVDFI